MGAAPPTTDHSTVTVCITNLPNETTESDIRGLFSSYGAVRQIRLVSGEPYRRSRELAYLDLSPEGVEGAITALDGHAFNGSIIRVSRVSEKAHTPQVSKDPASGAVLPCPDNETPSNLLRRRYEVACVEKAAMPVGGQGGDWYRYVLLSGSAQITGLHRGTLEEVTAYATGCAERFNFRSATGKSTRVVTHTKKR
jgi:RNA recognition motif-containing protein